MGLVALHNNDQHVSGFQIATTSRLLLETFSHAHFNSKLWQRGVNEIAKQNQNDSTRIRLKVRRCNCYVKQLIKLDTIPCSHRDHGFNQLMHPIAWITRNEVIISKLVVVNPKITYNYCNNEYRYM